MKYTITHTCGCEETVELFGKTSERENRIAWLESQPCAKCRAEGSKLQGSVKQIAWAEDIKKGMTDTLAAIPAKDAEDEKNKALALDELNQIKEARWFIDHRSDGVKSLCFALGRHYTKRNAA